MGAPMFACESIPEGWAHRRRRGKISCAFALLEASAPSQEAVFPDRVVPLKLAGERLQLIEVVLAMKHAIRDAPSLANAGALGLDA